MNLRVVIDQHTANDVMRRDGLDGFDRWWEALGVLVRMTWPNDPKHAGKRLTTPASSDRGNGGS